MWCTILILSVLSIGYLSFKCHKNKKIIEKLENDNEEQHSLNHSHINTIFAISTLVDITWGKTSKYSPTKKEQMVIDQITSNLINNY